MNNLSKRDKDLFGILQDCLKYSKKFNITERFNRRDETFYPFYISLTLKNTKNIEIMVEEGGIKKNIEDRTRENGIRMHLRLGDYKIGIGEFDDERTPLMDNKPLKEIKLPLKRVIWKITNGLMYDTLEKYFSKHVENIKSRRKKPEFQFSKENPNRYFQKNTKTNIDYDDITQILVEASKLINKKKFVHESEAILDVLTETRYFIDTEGAMIKTNNTNYNISLFVKSLAEDGMEIYNKRRFSEIDLRKISKEEILIATEDMLKALYDMRKAKPASNGAFPTIIDGINHGVFWHEAIGHSTESHRIISKYEGATFVGMIGKKVTSDLITVVDDPTLPGLNGSYLFDEEGVKAQKAIIVEDGILKNYLHSRETAGYYNKKSNGHARADGIQAPIPRMSNIIITTKKGVPLEELKEMAIKIAKDDKTEYALMLKNFHFGYVMTEEDEENVFTIMPCEVYKIKKNGKIEITRGIRQVMTPYEALKNIVAVGDKSTIEYSAGLCGAESGLIPDSSIAPVALISSLEVHKLEKERYKEPLRVPPVR